MADTIRFRTALNGFHREDVVHHLEYLQNRHAAQVAQLKQELAQAQQSSEQLRDMLDDLRGQYAHAERERDEALARVEELLHAPAQREQAPSCDDAELEAYRRAERTERQAQQRAERLLAQAQALLADASVHADESAAHIAALAEQTAADLAALQQAVLEGKGVLRDAATAMLTVQPQGDRDAV